LPKRLAAVVVNYRTPEATVAAVRSIERSGRRPEDIVVVENGSGDDSETRLRQAALDAVLVSASANRGFAAGSNLGIKEALERGAERVLLVNRDAVLDPGAIQALEGQMDARPQVGVAGPVLVSAAQRRTVESLGISVSPRTGRVRLRGFGRGFAGQIFVTEMVAAVSGCVMLIDRRVFERVGMLRKDYF
jgi:GT2 family glycosyltransferase